MFGKIIKYVHRFLKLLLQIFIFQNIKGSKKQKRKRQTENNGRKGRMNENRKGEKRT